MTADALEASGPCIDEYDQPCSVLAIKVGRRTRGLTTPIEDLTDLFARHGPPVASALDNRASSRQRTGALVLIGLAGNAGPEQISTSLPAKESAGEKLQRERSNGYN